MRIDVTKIPPEGLQITTSYDPILMELEREDIRFNSPIEAALEVHRHKQNVIVNATVHASMESTCARCLESFEKILQKKMNFYYPLTAKDTELDVTPDIKEEIFLDYPMKSLCSPDCRGLCAICGQNLNEGECPHGSTEKTTF